MCIKFAHAQCTPQGFTWDLAATYHGLLIFIEHRYYGESLPFGPSSYQDPSHLNYLSSGQALADYATVITDIKVAILHIGHMYCVFDDGIGTSIFVIGSLSVCIIVHVQKQLNTSVPVIAVGGSYGGMYKLPLDLLYSVTVLWLYCYIYLFKTNIFLCFHNEVQGFSKKRFYISSTIYFLLL